MKFMKIKITPCVFGTILNYCMNGIESGYLNGSPLAALMLPIIVQTTFNVIIKKRMGNPIIIKHNGMVRNI